MILILGLTVLLTPDAWRLTPACAQDSTAEEITKKVRLDQKMNAPVPLDLEFREESGRTVRLGEYFGEKPVMLMLIQYRCTMLCNEEMNVLLDSLEELKFDVGKQFNLLIVSIDPRETPELAAEKKAHYLKAYGRPDAEGGWHFLTGEDAAIKALAAAVGFRYAYDALTDQYAHPDGVIILTPKGRTARYYFKLNYAPKDLRFGLIEAAANRIGTPLDALALLCYHYNPVTGTYGVALMKVLRLAAVATVLFLGTGIAAMKRRERRRPAPATRMVRE